MRKFPAVGISTLAQGTTAVAALESRGFTVAWTDFTDLTPIELDSFDVLIVDIATPALPDAVWAWVAGGGGLVCVGQPSAAIAAEVTERTGRVWTPGAYELVTLSSPIGDVIPALDLLSGVGQVKASSTHWTCFLGRRGSQRTDRAECQHR